MNFDVLVNNSKKCVDVNIAIAKLLKDLDSEKAIFLVDEFNSKALIRQALIDSGGSSHASRYGLDGAITFSDSEIIAAYERGNSSLDFLKYRLDFKFFPKEHILRDFPLVIAVEASSSCNLRCKMCFQQKMDFQAIRQNTGIMSYDVYQSFLSQIEDHNLYSIVFASRGEPLLNPNIDKMIYEAKKRGVLDIKLNTNAILLSDTMSRKILSSGLDMIVFSVDSINSDTYRRIRGADLEIVKSNIERFINIKEREYPSSRIVTRVGMVITDDVRKNKDEEISAAKEYWLNLVDELSIKSENDFRNVYEKEHISDHNVCNLLWERLYLWNDGTLNPCDIDYLSTLRLGNITEGDSISEVWSGHKMQQLRNLHVVGEKKSCGVCSGCSGY